METALHQTSHAAAAGKARTPRCPDFLTRRLHPGRASKVGVDHDRCGKLTVGCTKTFASHAETNGASIQQEAFRKKSVEFSEDEKAAMRAAILSVNTRSNEGIHFPVLEIDPHHGDVGMNDDASARNARWMRVLEQYQLPARPLKMARVGLILPVKDKTMSPTCHSTPAEQQSIISAQAIMALGRNNTRATAPCSSRPSAPAVGSNADPTRISGASSRFNDACGD